MNGELLERPEFKIWPWQLATILVPTIALVVSVGVWKFKSPNEEHFIPAYLATLGGGTAMLYASATREFWRHVIAIPIAVLVGGAAITMFKFLPVVIVFLILLSATFFSLLIRIIKTPAVALSDKVSVLGEIRLKRDKVRLIGTSLSLYLVVCCAAFYKPGQLFLSYPLVCSFVTALFPGETSIAGRLRAWEHGTKFCFKAMAIGLIVVCLLFLAIDQACKYFKVHGSQEPILLLAAVGVAMIPTHYLYTRGIFLMISSVELGL